LERKVFYNSKERYSPNLQEQVLYGRQNDNFAAASGTKKVQAPPGKAGNIEAAHGAGSTSCTETEIRAYVGE